MHFKNIVEKGNGLALKIIFFIALFTFSVLMYYESRMIIDACYLSIVLIMFLKYLTVKLYQWYGIIFLVI